MPLIGPSASGFKLSMRSKSLCFILFYALICISATQAWAKVPCPLGAKESELTLSRIMRNMGRYIGPAESVVLKGAAEPSAIDDSELQQAIKNLDVVVACTEAGMDIQNPSLLPLKALEAKEGDGRTAFLHSYTERMRLFADQTRQFQDLLQTQLDLPAHHRSFEEAQAHSKRMNDHIDLSHRTLSCWEILE